MTEEHDIDKERSRIPTMTEDLGDKERLVIKVIVLGSANVGKSALMERYIEGTFTGKRMPTLGTNFRTKILEIHDTSVVLQIWDTAGLERFHHGTLGSAFYRGAHGAMLVYDVTNPRSIQQLAQSLESGICAATVISLCLLTTV